MGGGVKDTLELLKEHLKYVCWMGHDEEQEQVLKVAIKEIKELRKTQVATDDGLTAAYMLARKEAEDEIKALRAENERLREALRQYACDGECANCYGPVQDTKYCGKIARTALGEEK